MKIKQAEFKVKIGKLRSVNQKLLNDTFIWSDIAIRSLKEVHKNEDFLNLKKFIVPSSKKDKLVNRSPSQVKKIIESAYNQDLLYSVFIFGIAQFEAFLSDLIKESLLFDNRKIKTNVPGINHTNKIDVSKIIDSDDKGSLIELIIDNELISVFYSSPQKQREYLIKVLGLKVDEENWAKWNEYKATRDLIVHNQGIINELYLKKASTRARGEMGDKIEIDINYFRQSFSEMKSLIGRFTNQVQKSLEKE